MTLAVGGNKLSQEFKTERDFGEQLVEFAVPEFSSVMKGEATVLLNGRSKRFPLELSPGRKWNTSWFRTSTWISDTRTTRRRWLKSRVELLVMQ